MLRVMTVTALAIAGVVTVVAPPTDASTAYRYWSYWTTEPGSTEWRYAIEGSGTRVPVDGGVEGWRFGLADDASRIQPTGVPDFASICAGTSAPDEGAKRVAVVIDPGTPAEAPQGETPGSIATECVVTDEASTGLQILQSIVDVRMDAGFVCGIDGYPATECAPLVDIPKAPAVAATTGTSASDEASTIASQQPEDAANTGTPLITAATVSIIALVGFGLWRHRRRQRA